MKLAIIIALLGFCYCESYANLNRCNYAQHTGNINSVLPRLRYEQDMADTIKNEDFPTQRMDRFVRNSDPGFAFMESLDNPETSNNNIKWKEKCYNCVGPRKRTDLRNLEEVPENRDMPVSKNKRPSISAKDRQNNKGAHYDWTVGMGNQVMSRSGRSLMKPDMFRQLREYLQEPTDVDDSDGLTHGDYEI